MTKLRLLYSKHRVLNITYLFTLSVAKFMTVTCCCIVAMLLLV